MPPSPVAPSSFPRREDEVVKVGIIDGGGIEDAEPDVALAVGAVGGNAVHDEGGTFGGEEVARDEVRTGAMARE